jgi:hypothetical protein
MVCGEAELCDYKDYAEAIMKYYNDRDLMKRHGENSRKKILNEYPWEVICDKLHGIIKDTVKDIPVDDEVEVVTVVAEEEDININTLTDGAEPLKSSKPPSAVPPAPTVVDEAKSAPKKAARKPAASKMTKEKLKEKMAKSKQVDELDEIKELKKKLDALLAKTGTVA